MPGGKYKVEKARREERLENQRKKLVRRSVRKRNGLTSLGHGLGL